MLRFRIAELDRILLKVHKRQFDYVADIRILNAEILRGVLEANPDLKIPLPMHNEHQHIPSFSDSHRMS